ncbi:MAG: PAS domain S-box protein, partial [Armatimonadota bacterium]
MCQELSPLRTEDARRHPYSSWTSKREQYLSALDEVQHRLLAFKGEGRCYKDVLEPLGIVSGASRVYVFENHRDESGRVLMSQKAEWCAKGVKPEIDNPLLQNYPYDDYAARLLKGEILTGIVRNLPDFVRAVLEPQGILTILLIPLFVNGEPFGFIGFDNCAEEREWEPPEIDLLRAAAGAISLAIERQHAEEQAKRLAAELEKRVEERTRALRSANEALRAEIAERKRAELARVEVAAEADRARAFLQAAINTIPVGIILSDAEGIIILSNSTAVSMLGEDPTGQNPSCGASSSFAFRGYKGESYSGFHRILKVLQSGRAFGPVEHLIQRSDGTTITALTSITPVFDSAGRTTGTVVVLADITALKDRERELTSALQKAEEGSRLLQALMEYIPEGVLVASAPDGNLIMTSQAAAAMIGCSAQELLAMSVQQRRRAFDVRYPDGREVPEEELPLVRAISSGEVVEGEEYLIPTRDGKRINILCNAGPIRDSEGRIIAGVLVYRDFTEL